MYGMYVCMYGMYVCMYVCMCVWMDGCMYGMYVCMYVGDERAGVRGEALQAIAARGPGAGQGEECVDHGEEVQLPLHHRICR